MKIILLYGTDDTTYMYCKYLSEIWLDCLAQKHECIWNPHCGWSQIRSPSARAVIYRRDFDCIRDRSVQLKVFATEKWPDNNEKYSNFVCVCVIIYVLSLFVQWTFFCPSIGETALGGISQWSSHSVLALSVKVVRNGPWFWALVPLSFSLNMI